MSNNRENEKWEFLDSEEEYAVCDSPISLDGPTHSHSTSDYPIDDLHMYTITARPSYYERSEVEQLMIMHEFMKTVDQLFSDSILLCRYEKTKRGNIHAHALISASKERNREITRYCRRESGITFVKDVFDFSGAYNYIMKDTGNGISDQFEISGNVIKHYRNGLNISH